MTESEKKQLRESLKKNKRQVGLAINHLNSFHLRSVRKGTKVQELELDNIFAKLILPLWISLFEIELDLIVYGYPMFDSLIATDTFGRKSEVSKWTDVVNTAFRAQYGINPKRPIDANSLGDTNFHRYQKIAEAIAKVDSYIQVRNRLAHGQWAIAFNDTGRDKNQKLTQQAWTLSKKDLMIVKIYHKNMPHLINDLCTSRRGFETNYDKYMNRINLVAVEIDNRFKILKSKTPEHILKHNGYSI